MECTGTIYMIDKRLIIISVGDVPRRVFIMSEALADNVNKHFKVGDSVKLVTYENTQQAKSVILQEN